MSDDWLTAVEQSADAVNAATAEASTSGTETGVMDTALNPFVTTPNGDNCKRASTRSPVMSVIADPKKPAADSVPTPKENVAPATPVRRKSRQLPTPNKELSRGNGRLRRSASLSFLPSSDGSPGGISESRPNSRRRRVLPDTGQGRLIKEVHERLDEEARLRLEVVAELKDEKRRRWKLEDTVQEHQATIAKLKSHLDERRKEVEGLRSELDDERRGRVDADTALETRDRELKRVRANLQRLKDTQASEDTDAAIGEQALQEAYRGMYEERRLRQAAETDLESIKRGILVMGGHEVLAQILASAADYSKVRIELPDS